METVVPILSWWRTKKRGSGPLSHHPGAKPCHPLLTLMRTPPNNPKREQEEEALPPPGVGSLLPWARPDQQQIQRLTTTAATAWICQSCAVAHDAQTSIPARRHLIVPSAHGPVRTVWSLAVVAGHRGSVAGIGESGVVRHIAVVKEIGIGDTLDGGKVRERCQTQHIR